MPTEILNQPSSSDVFKHTKPYIVSDPRTLTTPELTLIQQHIAVDIPNHQPIVEPIQPRQAFDIKLVANRWKQAREALNDPREAYRVTLDGVQKDWQAFTWEYGLKKDLRFTPYEHTYFQRGDCMVAEEDLSLLGNIDFLTRLDPSERKGLVYKSFEALKRTFINADIGDTFIWASPKSEDNEGFSGYSFAYFGRIENSIHGKSFHVWDFFSDLSKEEFTRVLNRASKSQTLAQSTSMEQVLTSITKTNSIRSHADVWKIMIDAKPDHAIFGVSLPEILSSNDPVLLAKVKEKSRSEAIQILAQLEQGIPISQIQATVGDRLLKFVSLVTGQTVTEVYQTIAAHNRTEGSCGDVSYGLYGPMDPKVTEISPITGRKQCRVCHKPLKYFEAYCMTCKFC